MNKEKSAEPVLDPAWIFTGW